MKFKSLLLGMALSAALTAAAQPSGTSSHLLAPEYKDPALLSALKIDAAQLQDKKGLAAVNRLFLEAAEASPVQPNAKLTAPKRGSQPAVDLYVYYPEGGNKQQWPVVYFIHGDGYLIGNARQNNESLAELARLNQVAVVSVEYRLAPEAPFPADIDDAYHGLAYMLNHADQFKIDKEKFILMGESAGGGLAARLALKVRDKGEFKPKGQVLIYPMLDYRTGTAQSPYDSRYAGEFVWTAQMNRIGWETLKGGQTIAADQMPYYSAATAQNLSGLPRTYMMAGSLDLFVNENLDYANRLIQAGVPTDFQLISGVYHAFEAVNPQSPQTRDYKAARTQAIQRMLAE
ncbi:alpha/beta hydrolase [Actinobacillus succinogenes]|uniref:Alpha/beta hydrolase fold-3 domain protein n=2 Tax=Actinobacillus succinogenes TaxID=67854 RepID=A6VPV2_ACTSZ|nr:Alpha/beta hydrolase fold-3 domain protein [Actinobacillus succinogenes 130Z]PHI41259.1 alpha/beta hydrolase [Actinobacillus succinogenes]